MTTREESSTEELRRFCRPLVRGKYSSKERKIRRALLTFRIGSTNTLLRWGVTLKERNRIFARRASFNTSHANKQRERKERKHNYKQLNAPRSRSSLVTLSRLPPLLGSPWWWFVECEESLFSFCVFFSAKSGVFLGLAARVFFWLLFSFFNALSFSLVSSFSLLLLLSFFLFRFVVLCSLRR